jgi:formylglycine-generating enzyme required for sulfatase activity
MKHTIGLFLLVFVNPVLGELTFEWATVGNPGNAADTTGFGSVGNEYRIAKHEVTNVQYTEFLNAVAATDSNGLYHASMGSDARGGITLGGTCGNTYCVKANMGNKPVSYVSFFDAMRFVNWLHNGQPSGAQDASTTEDGVYTISDGLSETRAVGAQFFIPTENEWYKGAYHQPSVDGGDIDDYWMYPTASNSVPTVAAAIDTIGPMRGDIANPGANVANYDQGADWNELDGNVTTVGSAGALSESFYGTSDQGGNLSEWNETVFIGSLRVVRGGTWQNTELHLRSSTRGTAPPTSGGGSFGFRVASPAAEGSWDLAADWSDSVNPNGVWSYNATPGVPIANHTADFDVFDDWDLPQPAWQNVPTPGNGHTPVWLKIVSGPTLPLTNPLPDVPIGTVGGHISGPSSLVDLPANFTWTSPIDGTVQIEGGVWLAIDVNGRSMDWSLRVNDVAVTGGNLSPGDPYDSTNPFDFNDGFGGLSVLTQSVSIGDVIELRFERTHVFGEWVGVDFSIISIEEIPTVSEWGLAAMVLLMATSATVVFAQRKAIVPAPS